MKRTIDVVASALLLVVALPLMLVLALWLGIALRAWPFFTQERVGLNGRVFTFVKLRTLPASFDPYADKYHLPWHDVPWIARKARTYHLDELPQLVLVLLGRMSLVGPRPEMPNLHHGMPGDFAAERVLVRPGCTGLWQIGAGAGRLIGESPEYDRFYLSHRSLRLDGWIMARTLAMMALGWPLVALDEVPAWARGDVTERAVPASFEVQLEPVREKV